jgi:hypothetical protein
MATSLLDDESDLVSSKRRLSWSCSGSLNDPSPKRVYLSITTSGDVVDNVSLPVNADCILTECRLHDLFELGIRV